MSVSSGSKPILGTSGGNPALAEPANAAKAAAAASATNEAIAIRSRLFAVLVIPPPGNHSRERRAPHAPPRLLLLDFRRCNLRAGGFERRGPRYPTQASLTEDDCYRSQLDNKPRVSATFAPFQNSILFRLATVR